MIVLGQNFMIFLKTFFFRKFYHCNISHFGLAIRRNSCRRHATGIFFFFFYSLLLALSSVNFDVCSTDFVMYLLNGVPFLIFVLKKFIVDLVYVVKSN